MRIAVLLVASLGLQACGNRTGIKKPAVDASTEVASPTGAPDSGNAATDIGRPLDLPDASAPAFPDAPADQMGTPGNCVAFAPSAADRELSVGEILENVGSLDPSVCVPLKVKGKVFEDLREKPAEWPAPMRSLFVLQDGGELPGYMLSTPRPNIQLYAVDDLSPTLHKQVHVTAHLRVASPGEGNGKPSPILYLEVLTITADQDPPDGSVNQADVAVDGNPGRDLPADGQAAPREMPGAGSYELRYDSPRVASDAGSCSPGFIRTWVLEFPAGAKTVKVVPFSAVAAFPMDGTLSDDPGPVLHYTLKDVDGEVLVWRQGDAWLGQLTIFGSRVEAGCVRGELVARSPS